MSFLVQVPHEDDVDLLTPPDGGLPSAFSGAASFRAIFNQLLDGAKIETVVAGQAPTPKTDVASITWMNAPAGAPAIVAQTSYDPTGAASLTVPAPKLIITPSPGLPSGAVLQVKLDRTKVTGKKGAQFTGTDVYMVTTMPFAASANVMGGMAAPDLHLAVTFTNVPAMTAAAQITLTSGGMPVMAAVAPDAADPRVLTVTPMMWVIGQSYTLTVGKDAADLFGIKLPDAVVVNFTVQDPTKDGGVAPADGGAGIDGGAGTTEGGAPDVAAAEGGAPDVAEADGGAPDAAAMDTSTPDPDAAGADGGGGG